jgi:hypothetical protein
MRPISSDLQFYPVQADRRDLTVDRRDGVGEPTISVESSRSFADDRGDRRAHSMTESAALPTSALVREAIDTALDSVDALELQARDTARRFRRHAIAEAQQGLVYLVESTQTLLALAVMTAEASGTSIDAICAECPSSVDRDTHAALAAMIGRQLEHDWHGLARVIEQPFSAALRGWRDVFLALDGSTPPYGHAA